METDSDFEGALDESDAKAFSGVFRITYEDAAAVRTERVIEQCRRLVAPPHEYILAFCRLRNDGRLFRLDRIQGIVDETTGEELKELGGSRFGQSYEPLVSIYSPSDPLRAAKFDLDVLTFVATLSSKMRDSQVGIIADYLTQKVGVARSAELERNIKRHRVPGPEVFRQAMKGVPQSRADDLLVTAQALLDKVRRDGDLDRGVMAMLHARKEFFGRYTE